MKALSEKDQIEKNSNHIKDQYDKLCLKHKKTVDKLRDMEKVNKIVVEAKEKVDKKLKQLSLNFEKLAEKAMQLEDELKLAESYQKTKASINESNQDSGSLLSELQCIESNISTDAANLQISIDEPEEGFYTPRNADRRWSYTPNSKNFPSNLPVFPVLSVVAYMSINIPSFKEIRREPSEEYFILATQAVKMNSPHMDTICVIPHLILFEQAKKENVPFHKWHSWIEAQLNNEYIQTLYRKKNRFQKFKNFLKSL